MNNTLILDGKPVKEKLLNELKERKFNNKLVIITASNLSEASKTYVNNKVKACNKLGITTEVVELKPTLTNLKKYLQDYSAYDGNPLIVQLPFGNVKLNDFSHYIPAYIDVDGVNSENIGRLVLNSGEYIIPATANGIMKLLDYYGLGDVEGKNVVIIGRSHIVGLPLFQLMLHRNATITICHSKTANIKQYTKNADIIVVAVGKPKMLTADMIGDNRPVVIDVGINRVDGKLCGDVDFDSVAPLTSAITPVPGGVGQLTVACVVENVFKCQN